MKTDPDTSREEIQIMANNTDITSPARRRDSGLENPASSLEPGGSATFIGESHLRYLPSAETVGSFQNFESHQIDPGDPVTAMIVVKYDDVLGGTYLDIPYAQIFQYVPNTALFDFPASGKGVENPSFVWLNDIEGGRK